MSDQDEQHKGITKPLSTDAPKAKDLEIHDALVTELKAQNNFEHPDVTQKRNTTLQRLQKLLVQLVQDVGRRKGIAPDILREAGGRVFTYGSYRLGVYGPGSDIDTLMVAPRHVTREDFFNYMPDMIRKATTQDELTELVPVPGISVPIIKLEISGIPIDLIFCSLQVPSVKKDLDLADNNLLRGLNETDLKCVNGTRVTDRILDLVPQTRTFRIALRAIKIWASKRAIYGNVFGYPGGVAYAMMVARVCQLYPNAAAPVIVQKFFWLIKMWQWPSPIYLQQREKGPLGQPEWDPNVNPRDKHHLMPVITPAYPCMNSTHTITPSTKAVILRELERGHEIMTGVFDSGRSWKDLFVKHNFFTNAYLHYICVITAAKTKDAQQAWSGLVQSRLRRLVQGIEMSDADSVKLVQPFNKGVERRHECKDDTELEKTLHGSLDCQVGDPKTTAESADVKMQAAAQNDADATILEIAATNGAAEDQGGKAKDGPQEIWSTTFYLGIELVKGARNLDISMPIQNFRRAVVEWDGYNPDLHSIQIKHVRNYDLPADLFGDGETKPVQKSKKKKTLAAGAVDKKRSSTNAGLDENQDPAKRRPSGTTPGKAVKTNGAATPNGTAG